MKLFRGVAVGLWAFELASCMTTKSPPDTCKTAVKYSGYKFEITGLEVPDLKFKLASAAWGDVALQQAQAVTQALDVLQFGDCQSAKLLPADDESRAKLFAASSAVKQALIEHASAFEQAKTPAEAGSALEAAKADANKLAAAGNAITSGTPEAKK